MTDQSRQLTDDPERVDLHSADIVEPRARALADLFPEAVRDGRIDLEALAPCWARRPRPGPRVRPHLAG